MSQSKKCAVCGGPLETTTSMENHKVAGQMFAVGFPVKKCGACGETFVEGEWAEDVELIIARHLALNGARSGEAFRYMRKALGMRATDLAALLDVAPETISRWETGERNVDRGALFALGSLVLDRFDGDTTAVERLRAVHEPPRLAKVVKLELPTQRRRTG
jgi:hypothetical protein